MTETTTTETEAPVYVEVESDESDFAFDAWILDAWDGDEDWTSEIMGA